MSGNPDDRAGLIGNAVMLPVRCSLRFHHPCPGKADRPDWQAIEVVRRRLLAVGGEMATRFSGGPTRVRTPETVQSHRVAQSGLPVVGFGLIAKAQPCGCALRRKVQA